MGTTNFPNGITAGVSDGVAPTVDLTGTADAPAGGTGATAGAYDTAAHRDAAIAAINANRADIAALHAALVAAGIIKVS